MFSKFSVAIFALLALFTFVTAVPQNHNIKNSCNTGSMYCCNHSYEGNSYAGKILALLLGLDIPVNTDLGAACSPLNVVGVNTDTCNQQPVCCTGNNYQGLLVVGCSPVSAA